MRDRKTRSSWWIDLLFLSCIFSILFFAFLGTRPLFVPDEGRYAEIAREMVASSDYITPHLNSIKYFEKPILLYWLEAIAIKMGGVNLWSIRSVNALLGLCGCLLTYFATRKLYDRTTGLLAALILGTSTLYFVMAHMLSLDLTVTVFITASLFGFLLGRQQLPHPSAKYYFWAASAAIAFAVLAKGLIGIVFPMLIVGTWIMILNEWRLLKKLYLPSCLLIFLLIVLPWHVLVGLRNPEFFYFYIIEQHFLRYLSPEVGHYQPAWFFIPVLILGFFPWIVFLPQTIMANLPTWKTRQHYSLQLFLLIWVALIFAFFSFSKSKLIPYILPIFPPLAMLTANYLIHQAKKNLASWGIYAGYSSLLLFSLLIAWVFYEYAHNPLLPDPTSAKLYLYSAAMLCTLGACVALFYSYQRRLFLAINITIITASLFLLMVLISLPAIDTRSIRPLAMLIKSTLQPEDEIITYNQYYQDLPFYLQRRVSILNWRNELQHGMEYQDTHEWMIDDKTFWQHWDSPKRVCVMMSISEYQKWQKNYPQKKSYILGQTSTNIVMCNQQG